MKHTLHNRLIKFSFFIGFIVFFNSCTKNNNEVDSAEHKLSFVISGVSEIEDVPEMIASTKNMAVGQKKIDEKIVSKENISLNGFDAEIILSESGSLTPLAKSATVGTSEGVSNNLKAKTNLLAASSPVNTGTTYRVLVYDEAGTYVGAVDGTSGTLAGSIDVSYNKNYKWYAYSFDNTSPLPALGNTANPTINATPSLGLLYASGEVTPTALGDNKVQVVFERRLSWVKLIVDSRGTFAPLVPAGTKVTTSNLTSSIFDIKSNSYSNPQNTVGTLEGSADFSELDAATTKDSVFVGNFYPADDGRNSTFSIKFDKMELKLDYSTNPSSGNVSRLFTDIPYTFNFVPSPGKRYTVRVRLIESAVDINGTKWARGNLHYTWSDNGFRFRHSGVYPYESAVYPWIYTNTPTDYYYNGIYPPWTGNNNYSDFNKRPVEFWNFKTVVPYAGDQLYDVIKIYGDQNDRPEYVNPYIGKGYYYESISGPTYYTSIPDGDPCSLVYPAGKWRLPTKAEGTALVSALQANTSKSVYTDASNAYYVGKFPYTTATPDVYGNILEFPFHGSITTAAGWTSGGMGPGFPSDMLGSTGDPRFGYEKTNSYYWYGEDASSNDKSAYMMFWTSDAGSQNTNSNGTFPYGWAFSMKIKDGAFVTPASGAYPNLIGGYPDSNPGGPSSPQVREAYQGDGLNIRCVRTN
ncbi:hypothetical protein LZQ00_16665 [Sphingobacterium sp. SRCM116780]|uniref:hypothetical protein n=1 Tax=Sphingobacterium sp. SRCM116780 TaxID=2907623 RepID=UPI001F3C9DF8|nr:hypothetical protein [Sphingobacterium sp. SRCM116780]UIR55881.1 hypothetical protein LZQ00_16665 [Sphingobacterium sp. SRCM116780]